MWFCDTCFTRDCQDPTLFNAGPVSILEIMQELNGPSSALYRLHLPPTSLTMGCQKEDFVLKVAV